MSLLQIFETNSYRVSGRHYSGTNNIRGFIISKNTKCLIVLLVKEINQ